LLRRRSSQTPESGRLSYWAKDFHQTQSWKPTDAAKGLLIEHQILQTQRRDVATVDRKIMGVRGKRRYYVIDGERLAAVVAADSDQSD
jgi:hypothetical protein